MIFSIRMLAVFSFFLLCSLKAQEAGNGGKNTIPLFWKRIPDSVTGNPTSFELPTSSMQFFCDESNCNLRFKVPGNFNDIWFYSEIEKLQILKEAIELKMIEGLLYNGPIINMPFTGPSHNLSDTTAIVDRCNYSDGSSVLHQRIKLGIYGTKELAGHIQLRKYEKAMNSEAAEKVAPQVLRNIIDEFYPTD